MRVKKWGMGEFFLVFAMVFVVTWMILSLYKGPKWVEISRAIDGDTLELKSGERVRLLGVDAPDNGQEGFDKARAILEKMVKNSKVWIEGDRYEKDQYGRILGWIWIGCESEPDFKENSYMEKIYEENRGKALEKRVEGNPVGCRGGILVNEQLVKMGVVERYFVENEGELKYGERLRVIFGQ